MALRNELLFTVEAHPMPHQRTRVARGGRHYNTAKQVSYQRYVATIARKAADGLQFVKPVKVQCAFYFARPKADKKKELVYGGKGDVDNLLKQVLDSLNGAIWKDDSCVVDITGIKMYTDGPERTIVRVIQLEDLVNTQ
jgi:Holliday junction resolvase RusA-like endonuclease